MEMIILAQRDNRYIYAQDDRCYKVFDKDYNKAVILNEAYNLSVVEETDLNVPKLLEVSNINGYWTIVTEYLGNTTLADLMVKNSEKFDEYLNQFVDLQIKCQNTATPLLKKHNDKMNLKIASTDLSATLRYDLHRRVEAMPKLNQLCHGDFNPTNVIVKDDKLYVLDWSHATQGNGEADAARTYLLFCLEKKDDIADKYLDLYCRKTGIDKDIVKAWLPILAATQSVKGIKDERSILNEFIYETRGGK